MKSAPRQTKIPLPPAPDFQADIKRPEQRTRSPQNFSQQHRQMLEPERHHRAQQRRQQIGGRKAINHIWPFNKCRPVSQRVNGKQRYCKETGPEQTINRRQRYARTPQLLARLQAVELIGRR